VGEAEEGADAEQLRGQVAPIHRTNTRAMPRMMRLPVPTPIWLDRKLPTKGTRKTPETMPWLISAARFFEIEWTEPAGPEDGVAAGGKFVNRLVV
jgi:hypothetical protein